MRKPHGETLWRALWRAGLWDGLFDELQECSSDDLLAAQALTIRYTIATQPSESGTQCRLPLMRWMVYSALRSAFEYNLGYSYVSVAIQDGLESLDPALIFTRMKQLGLDWGTPDESGSESVQAQQLVAQNLTHSGRGAQLISQCAHLFPLIQAPALTHLFELGQPCPLPFQFLNKETVCTQALLHYLQGLTAPSFRSIQETVETVGLECFKADRIHESLQNPPRSNARVSPPRKKIDPLVIDYFHSLSIKQALLETLPATSAPPVNLLANKKKIL